MATEPKKLTTGELMSALAWWLNECQNLVDADFKRAFPGAAIAPPRLKVSVGAKYIRVYYGPWANPLPVSNGFWGTFGWVDIKTGSVYENHGQVKPAPSLTRPIRGNITTRGCPVRNYCGGNGGVFHPPY